MTDNHPITPPPELVEQWTRKYDRMDPRPNIEPFIATRAAQWGADQELEACCKWQDTFNYQNASNLLRAARRPKPPSLSEPAMEALDRMDQFPTAENQYIIRRALERLQELEGND